MKYNKILLQNIVPVPHFKAKNENAGDDFTGVLEFPLFSYFLC